MQCLKKNYYVICWKFSAIRFLLERLKGNLCRLLLLWRLHQSARVFCSCFFALSSSSSSFLYHRQLVTSLWRHFHRRSRLLTLEGMTSPGSRVVISVSKFVINSVTDTLTVTDNSSVFSKYALTHGQIIAILNESVPIQLAQCWFPRLAISNAEIL